MRFFTGLLICLSLLSGCERQHSPIQVFTHEGCPYCEKAMQYIKINYPKLSVQVLEIGNQDNMKLFVQCADRFHLDRNQLGTPLICMGGHYIMGWSQDNQKLFNEYVKTYLPK